MILDWVDWILEDDTCRAVVRSIRNQSTEDNNRVKDGYKKPCLRTTFFECTKLIILFGLQAFLFVGCYCILWRFSRYDGV